MVSKIDSPIAPLQTPPTCNLYETKKLYRFVSPDRTEITLYFILLFFFKKKISICLLPKKLFQEILKKPQLPSVSTWKRKKKQRNFIYLHFEIFLWFFFVRLFCYHWKLMYSFFACCWGYTDRKTKKVSFYSVFALFIDDPKNGVCFLIYLNLRFGLPPFFGSQIIYWGMFFEVKVFVCLLFFERK